MKKVVLIVLALIFLSVCVFADSGNKNLIQTQSPVNVQAQNSAGSGSGNQSQNQVMAGKEIRERLMEQTEYMVMLNGKNITFEQEQNKIRIRTRNASADCDCNITEEFDENNKTILRARFSNGKNAEIKIMPDTVAERALERLRLKVCNETNNCTIELKYVGEGNKTRLQYELQAERHYKILGLFKAKAQNKVQIDAENGEVFQVKKPWWAFLASSDD